MNESKYSAVRLQFQATAAPPKNGVLKQRKTGIRAQQTPPLPAWFSALNAALAESGSFYGEKS
ncbi:MAG: hypothetical protein LBC53_08960 [Spirochaetaceae bacterium]|nr:hypothetical protein [Spirochaetaceae bacterium]